MESISIANKILKDPTRFYGIVEKNAMEYQILRNTRQKCYGIHINSKQDPMKSYKILQDPTRFYRILDKNALESISIANKILQDPARSYKILQDPSRFYGILDKNARNPYQ